VFVDHLAELRPLSGAQRSAITSFLDEAGDLDDLLARTVRALTQLTGQVAIVQYPSFARANLSHVELVALGGPRVLVILVTDTGRVSQRIALVPAEPVEADIVQLRARVGAVLVGRSVADCAQQVAAVVADGPRPGIALDAVADAVFRVVGEELEEFRQDRLVMAGAATLAKRESDFRGSIYPLLEAIEEQVTLLRLMTEMVADEKGLSASIGRENEPFGLIEASVLASRYDGSTGGARVGLLGPTRMDYSSNLAAVRAVAHYLTRMLEDDDSAR
jgi:heat-inducible transcriptional repressor